MPRLQHSAASGTMAQPSGPGEGRPARHRLQGSDCAATMGPQMSKAAGGGDDAVCQDGVLAAGVTLRVACSLRGLSPEAGLSRGDPRCWGRWLAPLGALLPGGTTGSGKSPLNGAVPAQGGGNMVGTRGALAPLMLSALFSGWCLVYEQLFFS